MSYIFMDESWCLWFDKSKRWTSKYFVVTFLFCENIKLLEKIPKKIIKVFPIKQQKTLKWWVLHCNKEKDSTRKKLLSLIKDKQEEIKIMSIILDKSNIFTPLKDNLLYNYIVNILLSRLHNKNIIDLENINFYASKRETNKFLNLQFEEYLKNETKNNHWKNINVIIKPHNEEKSLQVVDFVSWAIFRKYEFVDTEFYDIIKQNILEEDMIF